MKLTGLCIFLLLFANGCSNDNRNKSNLTGTWRLYDLEQVINESVDDDSNFSRVADLMRKVKEGSVLSFFEDDTYSEVDGNGEYHVGNYTLSKKDKSVSLVDSTEKRKPFTANFEKKVNGKQTLGIVQGNSVLKYVKESGPVKNFKNDPFYPKNNQWRLKPEQAETPDQLLSRLTGYIKHLALILKAAKDREQDIISFEFSQGPVKIYNGGIGIHPYDLVPEYWKSRFYNDTDALKAYSRYSAYLETSQYKGAGIGNWVVDDYNILLSIYSGLSQSK